MPPDAPPPRRTGADELITWGRGVRTKSTKGVSPLRCPCTRCRLGWSRPTLTLPAWPDLADLMDRPGVVYDMPADWWEMLALGRNPVTGERAA